jgi:hypothetical protein
MFCRLSLAQPSRRIRLEIDAEQLLFLRCLCQIICRLKFGTAPATEESKKARCSSAAFPKLFRSRNTCFPFYSVAALPEKHCFTSLVITGYKRLAEGGSEAFG